MRFGILGPLDVRADGEVVDLRGAKARALLAMLLLHHDEAVSAERLVIALWGEEAPPSAAKALQVQVSRLRKALGEGDVVETTPSGYRLRLHPGDLDAERFDALVDEGREALAAGEPERASAVVRSALALWRGAPLSDLAHQTFAAAEIRRLEEIRLDATELAIDAELAAGRHREVIGELEALAADHPLRERIHAQRMLALYRAGRQAEALDAYRHARDMLVEQIGVEPGPELRRLHAAILAQDAGLEPGRLPDRLDPAGAPALVGRDAELEWLRALWERARAGHASLAALVGPSGAGKTRLAAELAATAHRQGAAVLYATGWEAPAAVEEAIERARAADGPALLVLDDVDACDPLPGGLTALAARPVLTVVTCADREALPAATESARLAPLAADAVRAIAQSYTPGRRADEIPVDALLEASGGLPARVHETASAWARDEAARRVSAVAGRAAAGRSELRSIEAQLADDVADLEAARERTELLALQDAPLVCPFKGLASFGRADAGYFFGRERLVAELVAHLVGAPLLALVGPSGSGKSSVLQAGLLPALAGGVLPGSERWRQTVMRPGEHPLRELRSALRRVGGDGRGVLAVDQFEETFLLCRDERERVEFVDALLGGGALVVLAIRADLYGACAAYPALSERLAANHVLVGSMRASELRRAIEGPAVRAGLHVDPELVDALVADVQDEPGALPLLSSALLELWQRRDGRRLTVAEYERSGGVHGAVGRLAEDAFGRLAPVQQATARAVLLRLADEGMGGAVVRRRVPLPELAGLGEDVEGVVAALAERRLLTIGKTTVEVAHEALLREWPRLRDWLEEDAQRRRTHHHLAQAAREWDERGRDPADLYRGARLAVAQEWRDARELDATERAFLAASRVAGQRAQRRLRLVLGLVAALLVLAVAGALVAVHQRSAAREKARLADAQRLGSQALTESDLARSLLLARQAVALDNSVTTRSDLLSALLRHPAALAVMRPGAGAITAVDLSPDGRTLAVGGADGALVLIDTATRRPIAPPDQIGLDVEGVRFSPDGTRLAVVGHGVTDAFVEELVWSHGRLGRLLSGATTLPIVRFGRIAFSPDSRVLAVDGIYGDATPHPRDDELLRFDARTGAELGGATRLAATADPALVAYASGGRRVLSSSAGATTIRDAATLHPLRRLPAGSATAAVSPDGATVALGGSDGSVRLLDVRSGAVRQAAGRHDGPVTAMAFMPDSHALLSAGGDGRVIEWDVARARTTQTFEGHAASVTAVAVAPDGRTAYSAGADGTVVAWDLGGARDLARRVATPAAGWPAVAPDGARFGVIEPNGSLDAVDSRTLARRRIDLPAGSHATQVAMARDGHTLAAILDGTRLGLWDARTGRPIGAPAHVLAYTNWPPSFSRDGRRLAFGDEDIVAKVWDVRRRTTAQTYVIDVGGMTLGPTIADAGLNPAGTQLAMGLTDVNGRGELQMLALRSLRVVKRIPMPAGRWSRYTPDGRTLLYGDDQGRVWRFDTRTWRLRGAPIGGQGGAIVNVDVSPDGRTLATGTADGTARLWDVASGRPIGPGLPGVAGAPVAADFLQSGTHLLTMQPGGGYVWDVRPASWERRACAIAGRTLTRAEWAAALPGYPYRPACAR